MKQNSFVKFKQGDINPQFSKIKNKKKLTAWLMRQYFDVDNNSKSPWFTASVNTSNVLKYISDPLMRFPLTPAKTVDMFSCIQSFKKGLKKLERECSLDDLLEEAQKPSAKAQAKYQTGEATLKKIGEAVGGLTPTMINKLSSGAMEKVRILSDGAALDDLTGVRVTDLRKFIMDCRVNAAMEYADDLKACKGDVKAFMKGLVKKRTVTANELKLIEDIEIESLALLCSKTRANIVQMLLMDISRDGNVFKTYQSAVSRKAFPEKKRGRPRKVDLL